MARTAARRSWVMVLATAGVMGGVLGSQEAGAQVFGRFETVAVIGQALPAGNGAGTLSTLGSVVINESGTVAYSAFMAGTAGGSADDSGMFIRTAGGVTRFVMREGQAVPGGNGAIGQVGTLVPQLNGLGAVGLGVTLTGTSGGSLDNGAVLLYQSSSNSLATLAREGVIVGNGEISFFNSIILAGDNRISFSASLRNTSGGTTDDTGVFLTATGGLDVVAREGSTTLSGGTYSGVSSQLGVQGGGAVAFGASVSGVPGLVTALYRSDGGNLVELARELDPIPGGSAVFGSLVNVNPVLNEVGQVVFDTFLLGLDVDPANAEGVFRSDGTTTVTILRKGQLAPKGGGRISIIDATRLNNRGQAAVSVTLAGSPGGFTEDRAIYLGSGSTLVELARSGNPVPGGDGVMSLGTNSVVLTDAGFIGFFTNIAGASSTAVDTAIYLADGTDTIQVAREGSAFAGSTITALTLSTSNLPSQRAVNESGQVAYRVNLANGLHQLVVFTPDLRYRSATSGAWDTVSRWTLGITPNALHDVAIDPAASVTVTGPANAVTVRSLVVGGGTGIGTLSLAGGTITSTNGVTVEETGVLTGDGVINSAVTNTGTVRAQNLTITGILASSGLITGSGRLTSLLQNGTTGQIRVEAGQHLILNTPGGQTLSNAGQVDVLGTPENPAELETKVQLTNVQNTGLIAGRNAILRFDPLLSNQGSLALSAGISDVFGDVNNFGLGRITITGGAVATFYGDVTQNGILRVATVGNTHSVAVFLGGFTGAGGATGGGDIFFEGDLRPGNSPAFVNFDANVSFGPGVTTFMELGGLGDGQYDRITVSGVLALDGVLDVRFLAGLEPSGGAPVTYKLLQAGALVGDFDSILLPTLVGRDWFIQRTDTSLTIGSFTVIPEPGAVGLLAVGLGLVGMRRRR